MYTKNNAILIHISFHRLPQTDGRTWSYKSIAGLFWPVVKEHRSRATDMAHEGES